MTALIVIGSAVYTVVAAALLIHAIESEDYDVMILAPVWPLALPIGLAMAAWAKAMPWRRGSDGR